jgi:hypothetical protein
MTEQEEPVTRYELVSAVAALREYLLVQLAGMDRLTDERFVMQVKSTETAFAVQQTAMRTAFDAADSAVKTALASAKEATTKAEIATEKRLELVNEFRDQQRDVIAQFLPRKEFDALYQSLTEKINVLSSRLDRGEAGQKGAQSVTGTDFEASTFRQFQEASNAQGRRAVNGQVIAGVAVLIAVASVVVTIVLALRKG